MNENRKNRSKGHNQTTHQLNSRQSRNYISGRLVSLIRANDQNSEFSAQELIQIESLLRDEFQTNQYLLNVCKAITDESVFVSKEELEMFEKYKNEGNDVFVTQSEVEELHKELDFLKERVSGLRYILQHLTQKYDEIQRNNSNIELKANKTKSKSVDIWLQMRTKLKESLEIIKKDLTTDFSVEEPKDMSDFITTQLNDNLKRFDVNHDPNEWLNEILDEMSLTEGDKRQLLNEFNLRFYLKLEDIHKNFKNLLKECVRIKDFYEINVKEEMSWRTDLNALINHLQSLNEPKKIEINSIKTGTNQLLTKKRLIEEYSQLFVDFDKQEFDELHVLIESLKKRIELLSDKTNSGNTSNIRNKSSTTLTTTTTTTTKLH